MIRIATACVHVLGLQEDRSGIEDLWMLTRLTELVPPHVEVSIEKIVLPLFITMDSNLLRYLVCY